MTSTQLILCAVLLLAVPSVQAAGSAEDQERTLQNLLAEAGSAQARGDFAAAAESYRKAVEFDPAIPELWANLGLMDHETGKHAEAMQSFKKAIALKPSLFVPQLFLGIEYLAALDPKSALPYLKTAAKLNPKDPQAALSLGRAYAMLELGSQAAEAYWRAAHLAPNDGSAWLALGTSYLQQVENDARTLNSTYKSSPFVTLRSAETFAEQGKLIEAENAYKTALAVPSPAPCSHAQYAITLLRQKKLQEAQTQLQLEEQSPSPCVLTKLGAAVASLAQGNLDAGLNDLSSIAVKDAAFVKTNLALFSDAFSADQVQSLNEAIRAKQNSGSLNAEIGDLIKAAFVSDDVPSIDIAGTAQPAEPSQQVSLANASRLQATGQYSACNNELRKSPEKLTVLQAKVLASCAFYSGDFRTASAAAQSLKKNPANVVQGLYWESKADEKLAIAALAHAGEVEPNSPQMRILLGDVFRQKRRWSEAESEYRKALALDPKSRSARLSLAIDLFTELKNEEALDLDKSLLAEVPDDPEANLLAGEILVQQHQFEQAEPYLDKCSNLKQDLRPQLHLMLGQVYSETGRIPEAISEYKLGLSTDQDGSIHYQLARLYQKSGDSAAASEQIRISKQLREHWDNQAHVVLQQRSTDLSRQ
jgi:tetratricopeptide (TPR) repeat protein